MISGTVSLEIRMCKAVLPSRTFRLASQCSKSQAFQLRLMGQCHIHQANGRDNGKTFVSRIVPIAKLQIRLTAISAKGAAHVCSVEPSQLSQWTTTTNKLRTLGIRLKRPLKFVQLIRCSTMIHGSISSVTQIGPHGWINLERYSFGQNLLRRPNNHNHNHNYNKTTLLLHLLKFLLIRQSHLPFRLEQDRLRQGRRRRHRQDPMVRQLVLPFPTAIAGELAEMVVEAIREEAHPQEITTFVWSIIGMMKKRKLTK